MKIETGKSVYRLGAENGLVMGPLMTAVAVLVAATAYLPWLGLPSLALILAVPAVTYVMLWHGYKESGYKASFSALWLQGICASFFGGLIMGALVFIALRWVWPGFIADQMRLLAEILSSSTDSDTVSMATAVNKSLEQGNLPAPIDIVLELIYVAVFTGSLLSMLLSLIIRSRRPQVTPPPFND
ncbi:MAG: DUF4199 domain-containing protein [Muribaculaceae bacterium]|nr:DUF4199 domain-containing protein [Muribaculaceae bacterium]